MLDPNEASAGPTNDGKVFCSKCARLFEYTSSALLSIPLPTAEPVQSATKFYFCEICGKRITDVDIEQGRAHDKKLKGVYCQKCSLGVETVERLAVVEEPVARTPRNPLPRITPVLRAPPQSVPRAVNSPIPLKSSPNLKIAGAAIAAVVVISAGMFYFRNPGHGPNEPNSQTSPSNAIPRSKEQSSPGGPSDVIPRAHESNVAAKQSHDTPDLVTQPVLKTDPDSKESANLSAYDFDFKSASSFEEFKKLFEITVPHQMEMKYDRGKLLFGSTATASSKLSSFHLQAKTLRLGANWKLFFRLNSKIGVQEATAGVSPLFVEAHIRFIEDNEKISSFGETHARFAFSIYAQYEGFLRSLLLGNDQHGGGSGSGGIFAGINQGISTGNLLTGGNVKSPASKDGLYDIQLEMTGNKFKVLVNGAEVMSTALPQAAVARMASSPLTLCLFSGPDQVIELQRFSFSKSK